MSAAAPNGKSTHAIPAGNRLPAGASVDKGPAKAGAKGKPKMSPEQRRQLTVVGIAAVVVLGVGVAVWAYFTRTPVDPEQRINEPDTQKIAAYVNSNDFDKLPFNRQRLHIKEISSQKKRFEDDFKAGKMSKPEFENVLALAWIGKQFKHMEKYYTLGQLDKKYFLDALIDDEKKGPPSTPGEPKKNKDKIKAVLDKFPQDERRMFDGFQKAIKERENERVREAKEAARAARAAATRPTSRPATIAPAGGAATPALKHP
jgi:hypothetical protein